MGRKREECCFVFACANPREGESRASGNSHKKSSGTHSGAYCVEDPEDNRPLGLQAADCGASTTSRVSNL